ncbi:alpha/beta hydrolase [Chitinophaga agrisoli]|uniref:Alpha/beta hydrolase n=1 Tax=Chitinophaga agrisoli TaxID=2607653 RepID=A0A5B2VJT3_9BACT|nr:alpha/beta hydrolase [Chitinophaga agrisoli]KAA2238840.1 alpha/beta hydrolase [Chitinophaga agrisoli]
MQQRLSLLLLQLFVFTALYGQDINYGNNPAAGKYVPVNGIQMYCEVYGAGRPLVLMHGNGGSIRTQKNRIIFFQQYFKVIAIDSRSQGKSLDPAGKSLTYEQMANDIKVLLDSLQVDSAYVWGQSDGGILGLILASEYPVKVAKLATFGANIFPGKKAVYPEIVNMIKDTLKTTTDFQTRKLNELMDRQPHITTAALRRIAAPTLIMAGNRDARRHAFWGL